MSFGGFPSLLLLAFVAWTLPARADLTLVENGRSLYRIVLATHALPAERYAAEELQRYLERISGAKLPIVSDADKPSRHEILLGDNARLRMLKPAGASPARGAELLRGGPTKPSPGVAFAQLSPDGFVLRTEGERLIIAGGKSRGTLYGVYALLEEKLGVRWFTPDLEVVPTAKRDWPRAKSCSTRQSNWPTPTRPNCACKWRDCQYGT